MTENIWKHVDDEVPEQGQRVIGYDDYYGEIGIAYNTGRKDAEDFPRLIFETSDDCHITHWQPLPKPPWNT